MKNRLKILMFGLLLSVFMIQGCSINDTSNPDETSDQIQVVATTTMITDLIEVIGGEHVSVEGLMGPGIDPHGYQATANDNRKIYNADIVAYNGLNLEGQMGEVFASLDQSDRAVFVIEDAIASEDLLRSEDADLAYDPHVWFDVKLWQDASHYITEQLSEYDPDNMNDYRENNEAYQSELEELDNYINERVAEIPEDQRYLVTAHDAFSYFGDAYGFEVVGIQGLNTQTEAGTGDISHLADFITENEINALFIESSVATRNIEALMDAVESRGQEIELGGELFSDSLGDEEQNAETYLKMFRQNVDTIVDALKE